MDGHPHMTAWIQGLSATSKVFMAVGSAIVAILVFGFQLAGWVGLPENNAQRVQAVEIVADQNKTDIESLDVRVQGNSAAQGEILERVRAVDRRTCIALADTPSEREDCASR